MGKFLDMFFRCIGLGPIYIDGVAQMEPVDRDGYKYIEGDHALFVTCEIVTFTNGKSGRLIYSGSIRKWLPPHEHEELTRADKERILKNICTYFDKLGRTYMVD